MRSKIGPKYDCKHGRCISLREQTTVRFPGKVAVFRPISHPTNLIFNSLNNAQLCEINNNNKSETLLVEMIHYDGILFPACSSILSWWLRNFRSKSSLPDSSTVNFWTFWNSISETVMLFSHRHYLSTQKALWRFELEISIQTKAEAMPSSPFKPLM